MSDLAHVMGNDLSFGASGDLAVVDGSDLSMQSISHRLLTASGGYIWHLDYGAGLPTMIGTVVSPQQIKAIIRAQLARDTAVAAVPVPAISVASLAGGVTTALITYTEAATGNGITQSIVLEG